ncbi:MAG: hypothetical protein H6Q90_894 [Deltaproteobacteria bacterium]|nr:hypothetical protein [Deltaproteobacteria bacterium]
MTSRRMPENSLRIDRPGSLLSGACWTALALAVGLGALGPVTACTASGSDDGGGGGSGKADGDSDQPADPACIVDGAISEDTALLFEQPCVSHGGSFSAVPGSAAVFTRTHDGTSSVIWRFGVATSGTFRVRARVPDIAPAQAQRPSLSWTTRARYAVVHGDGTAHLLRDQRAAQAGGMVDLGVYVFRADHSYHVSMDDKTGDDADTGIVSDELVLTRIRDELAIDCALDLHDQQTCNAHPGPAPVAGMPGGCSFYTCSDLPDIAQPVAGQCAATGTPNKVACASDQNECPVIDLADGDGDEIMLDDSGKCFTATPPQRQDEVDFCNAHAGFNLRFAGQPLQLTEGQRGTALWKQTIPRFLECTQGAIGAPGNEGNYWHGTYQLKFARSGMYELLAYVPRHRGLVKDGDRDLLGPKQAWYQVRFGDRMTNVTIDQGELADQGGWVSLSSFGLCFNSTRPGEENSQSLDLRDYAMDPGAGGQPILFDAIRVRRLRDCPNADH